MINFYHNLNVKFINSYFFKHMLHSFLFIFIKCNQYRATLSKTRSENGAVGMPGKFLFVFIVACPARRLVMHGRYWYVHVCIREQAVDGEASLPPFVREHVPPLPRVASSLAFVSRAEVRAREIRKIGRSDRVYRCRRAFFKWTISWNPISRRGR